MVIIKELIPRRELERGRCRENHLEGTVFLLYGWNFNKSNIDVFLNNIDLIIDKNISNIDNILLLVDLNSKVHAQNLANFW